MIASAAAPASMADFILRIGNSFRALRAVTASWVDRGDGIGAQTYRAFLRDMPRRQQQIEDDNSDGDHQKTTTQLSGFLIIPQLSIGVASVIFLAPMTANLTIKKPPSAIKKMVAN